MAVNTVEVAQQYADELANGARVVERMGGAVGNRPKSEARPVVPMEPEATKLAVKALQGLTGSTQQS